MGTAVYAHLSRLTSATAMLSPAAGKESAGKTEYAEITAIYCAGDDRAVGWQTPDSGVVRTLKISGPISGVNIPCRIGKRLIEAGRGA